MDEWDYHYRTAEDLLQQASEHKRPDWSRALAAQAQVHATLATIKYKEIKEADIVFRSSDPWPGIDT